MDITNIQIGLTTAISLFGALASGFSVFFALKAKILILENENEALKKEDITLHNRISELKNNTTTKSDNLLKELQSLKEGFKDDLHEMEIKIISTINKFYKP